MSVMSPETKRQKRREYYLNNRERLWKSKYVPYSQRTAEELVICAQKRRESYIRNRKQQLEASKVYQLEHPEVAIKKARNYGQKHRERIRKRSREYYNAHRQSEINRHLARNHLRRAQKNATVINEYGIKQWMAEVRSKPFARCYWCGTKVNGPDVYFDHVTPLSKGGTHTIGNICSSCQHCNQTKHARLIADWVVNGQAFLL